jgi:hypothetical protein
MSREVSSGLGAGVRSRFGPVNIPDGSGGVVRTAGNENEIVLEFSGEDINGDLFQKPVMPAGSVPVAVYVEIKEAFALGGTTPTLNIGTDGSEGTNGVELSEANAEATGTYAPSLAGTWASPLAAATTVSVALDGTTPTVTDAGHARVVIQYVEL